MTYHFNIDPLKLSQELIQCQSITPEGDGILDIVEQKLKSLGFTCHRLVFSEEGLPDVENLYARYGSGEPHLCFAGHLDVVPPGDEALWDHPPFDAVVSEGKLYGRGSADMKTGVASFIAAVDNFFGKHKADFTGSLSFLLTLDEETLAVNGTDKVLQWMKEHGESFDACLLGEPSCPKFLGEAYKPGRRGSLNIILKVFGTQGHVAWADQALNPLTGLISTLGFLKSRCLDRGTEYFPPSNLEVTAIETGNPTHNIIPPSVTANMNIRFNDYHTIDSLKEWLKAACDTAGIEYELSFPTEGEAFFSDPTLSPLADYIVEACQEVIEKTPQPNTGGGASDGRFICKYGPVLEFGIVGAMNHKANEHVLVDDIYALAQVYESVLKKYYSL